jgi:hypothetical protein
MVYRAARADLARAGVITLVPMPKPSSAAGE